MLKIIQLELWEMRYLQHPQPSGMRILRRGGSTCNSGWSQDYPNLPKNVCVYIYIYIYTHTKITYFDHSNENINYSDLKITRI